MPMSYVEDVSVGKKSSDAVVQIQDDSVENKQLDFSSVVQGDWMLKKLVTLNPLLLIFGRRLKLDKSNVR